MDEILSDLISEAIQHELSGCMFKYRDIGKGVCTEKEYVAARIGYKNHRRALFNQIQVRRFELGLITRGELENAI